MNPPFLPPSFAPGPPTTPAWEGGPAPFVPYNGQNQTATIAVANPPPGWEKGPGPADPNLSNILVQGSTSGGYGPIGQGTIGVGNKITGTPGPPPAQARMYVQGNQLIILDNQTGNAYAVPLATAIPQVPLYSPTK